MAFDDEDELLVFDFNDPEDPPGPFDPDPGDGDPPGPNQVINIVSQNYLVGFGPISMGATEYVAAIEIVFDDQYYGIRGCYNSNLDQELSSGMSQLFEGTNTIIQVGYLQDIGIQLNDYELYSNSSYEPQLLTDATPHSVAAFLDNKIAGNTSYNQALASNDDGAGAYYSAGTQRYATLDPLEMDITTFGSVINWTTVDLEAEDTSGAADVLVTGQDLNPDSSNDQNNNPLQRNPHNVGPHSMSEFLGKVVYDPEAIIGSYSQGGDFADFEGMFSDRRLKYDIKLVRKSPSGINIYNFKYKDKKIGKGIYQGVMSDEIPQYAVKKHSNGYDKVNYSMLDVKFKKINS
tara:strand:+ start:2894 stop:3934 length:1041 start_codon:yes stop_codon:yes gene_type:complete